MTISLQEAQIQLGEIHHLETDSRKIKPGDTFVAYSGDKSDGRQFIDQAIDKGANSVIWDKQNFVWDRRWDIANWGLSDLKNKAGLLADAVYGSPSDHLWMVGVTGTNGKTSSCHWIAQALNEANKKCALIGTLGNGFVGELCSSVNTTPGAIELHGLLADYLEAGACAVTMEVSSHALAQGRVKGVRFDVALFTNLTRDHLDYHGDMESYAASKRCLFDWESLKYAVINLDDPFGVQLAMQLRNSPVEVIAYGLTTEALHWAERQGMRMVYAQSVEMQAQGLVLDIHSSWGAAKLTSALVGRFNASNLLGVLAVLMLGYLNLQEAVTALSHVMPVAGRMQKLGGNRLPTVIIDYAHTPDALEKVLLTLREACVAPEGEESKLISVFGCGGERDSGKRSMMGCVAEKFSDYCIVTSDNPRSEDPQQIIAQVISGMSAKTHQVIVDRADAIDTAIRHARCKDVILVAGKGHEDSQEINGVKYPFSDVNVAMQALKIWSKETGGVL